MGPEPQILRQIAPGVVWVCALLAAMLSLNTLFASDHQDGSLEQMLLSRHSTVLIAAGKALAHWVLTGLPLILAAPVLGVLFDMRSDAILTMVAGLILGTPVLSLLGSIGAALTLGLRSGGVLILCWSCPLSIPVLIFGAGAVGMVDSGLSPAGHLSCWAPCCCCRSSRHPLRRRRLCVFRYPDANPFTFEPGMSRSIRLFTFAAPSRFYWLTGKLLPWLWATAALFAIAGLYMGFFVAPTDATQGDAYRIIFVHVPAAWMSMVLYLVMAGWAVFGWAANARLASMVARALAPTGAMFTFLALWTGALWGKPTWGTWWVWDARLTSELILLFLYLGYMALVESIDDVRRADHAGALLALIGAINVPVIYFSVRWWNTLHQGATISMTAAPKMAATMLNAMLLMTIAFWAYSFAVVFLRTRAIVLERERQAQWVIDMGLKAREASK